MGITIVEVSVVFNLLLFTDWVVRFLVTLASCFFYKTLDLIVSFHYEGVFAAFFAVVLQVPGRHTNFAT
jgi:hypothetical protein